MSKRKLPPPADFDENPVWTPEMHARARPADEVHSTEIAASMVRKAEFQEGRGYTREDWDAVSDNPEWTPEQAAQRMTFAEACPELAASIKRDRGGSA